MKLSSNAFIFLFRAIPDLLVPMDHQVYLDHRVMSVRRDIAVILVRAASIALDTPVSLAKEASLDDLARTAVLGTLA